MSRNKVKPKVGDKVFVLKQKCIGTIRWVGVPHFSWRKQQHFGVVLMKPLGDSDGSVKERRYFQCDKDHGLFLKQKEFVIFREDAVRSKLKRQVIREQLEQNVTYPLHHFMEAEDMDTDCIEDEMENYEEDGDCNLLKATKHQMAAFEALRTFIRRHRVCKKSFAVGKPLFYWEWHRTVKDEEIKKNSNFQNIKWDGHSIKDLLVSPQFDSIKEEALQSGLISAAKFEKGVVQKAARYLKQKKCRKMKSTIFFGKDVYHFEIAGGSPLSPRHLHSLFLYTDFTEFCTEFSRCFRALSDGEPIEVVVGRNSKYYHCSKALRELITLFGSRGYGSSGESGPFFCGINCVLNVPQFAVSFQCPTSTTKTKEIALRFAGESGMMMVLNNESGVSKYEMFFNAKPLSAFPEEDERLFIGSTRYLTVESLVVIQSAKNYRLSIGAFAKFDQVLNGQFVSGGITEQEMEIIVGALESVKGKGTASKMSKYLDEFAVDNFYLMTLQKTNIILDLYCIDELNNQRMKELVFHSVSWGHKVKGPNDTTNVVKAALFPLFPNLSTVTINACSHPFSVSRFLDELSSVDLPGSLSTVIIKDWGKSSGFSCWVRKAFGSNLKEKAAAMNMTVDLEEGESGYDGIDDFLTIRLRE